MRKYLVMLCAVLLLTLCGCGGAAIVQGEALHFFYPTGDRALRGGDVMESVKVSWEQEKESDAEEQVRRAVERLMAGDPEKNYMSPVPRGTTLKSCSVSGGTAWLDFSEEYGQLSGMDLSVADYCITLTLSQIPGIRMVRITVEGQELAYRDKSIFAPGDVLLTSEEDVVRNLTVQLYFLNGAGVLMPEERVLTLYEGENQADVLLDALLDGPESEELYPLLPEGFLCQAVRQEEGMYYIDLPQDENLLPKKKAEQEKLLKGIAQSLCTLEGVEQVQFLQGGEWKPEFGLVDISQPLPVR